MKTTILLCSALITLVVSRAEAGQFNINGTSCVPDASTTIPDLYHGTGGSVDFASAKTGTIIFYCPIPYDLGFTPTKIGIVYYDDSGIADNNVNAQLVEMDMTTGLITSISGASVNSDSGSITSGGNAATIISSAFVHTYSPSTKAYYIRVDIIRNTTSAEEKLYAVHLE
jgi:hypothetical protein